LIQLIGGFVPTIRREDQRDSFLEIQSSYVQYEEFRRQRDGRLSELKISNLFSDDAVCDVLELFSAQSPRDLADALSALTAPYEVDVEEVELAESGRRALLAALDSTGVLFDVEGMAPLDLLWMLAELVEAADAEDQMELERLVGTFIERVEGFRISARWPEWFENGQMPEPILYPFLRPAPGRWTVDEWLRKRVEPNAGDWEVWPCFDDGTLAESDIQLFDLRGKGGSK